MKERAHVHMECSDSELKIAQVAVTGPFKVSNRRKRHRHAVLARVRQIDPLETDREYTC